ncbi:putative Galactose-binding domain, SUN domain-containing protein [Lupinus albus]|uniref:Putative Galactose-binding domain, SUN domain-containing protein n=1 Tax=Lupinus albus TaxID=3870 RepID=A0A6A4NX63_LUPAL|nr:putative Galactose-binding domain, SUN domain-containing protein [Lupinus albus]
MQRSRKALLKRRNIEKISSERNYFYKVSLSLVFVLWGLVFLFRLWINCGHDDQDGSGVLPIGVSNGNKDNYTKCTNTNYAYEYLTKDIDAYIHSDGFVGESLPIEETLAYAEPDDKLNYNSTFRESNEAEITESSAKHENDVQKYDHLSKAFPVGIDEFKRSTIDSKINSGIGISENVMHRVEPGGAEYNYASASNGAKILASNKEAKGASNILSRDKDKYLINPCSSEEKFVIIELSEEILLDKIDIANFEHHSSNLKDFQLLGSLVYPTDKWVFLGNFTASNVKQAQSFVLKDPKWVKYLNLNLKSHYGSEFYCTLSIVEVYGVDAVEKMLEDLINTQDKLEHVSEISSAKEDSLNRNVPNQVGRIPGDTVLKILMQKVHFLDLNLSALEQYMEDLNPRYVNIFKVYSKDNGEKYIILEKTKEDIRSFNDLVDVTMKDVTDFDSWKSHISMQLGNVLNDNYDSRYEFDKIHENEVFLENNGVVVFCVCVIFSMLAILKLFLVMAMKISTKFQCIN